MAASGSPLSYQWYIDSAAPQSIAGATSATVTIFPTAPTTLRAYVTSGEASNATRWATATVNPGPNLLSPSKTGSGGCYTLTARHSSTEDGLVQYAWYEGALGDTTNRLSISKTYTVCPATTPRTYWTRVTYTSGTKCSSDRAVTVP
jgi:hypothetical protein